MVTPRPDVKLFNVIIHILNETTRHAGHADILREQLDGRTGGVRDAAYVERAADWAAHRSRIEQAARRAGPAT